MPSPSIPRLVTGSDWLRAVDCLEWTAGVSVAAFGVRIGVRVNDPAWLPQVEQRLPPGWCRLSAPEVDYLYSVRFGGPVPGTRIRRFHMMFAGPARVVRTHDPVEALNALEGMIEFDLSVAADPWVFVHAGVVGVNGRAVVVPAASMHGKSRLIEALVRRGATYYSDEVAVLGEDGRVHPFPRKLSIRNEQGGSTRVAAEDLGGRVGTVPLPIGCVVATRYSPTAVWMPRTGTPGECLLHMLSHTMRASLAPSAVLATLSRAVSGARFLDGPRGDADETAERILQVGSGDWPALARIPARERVSA